MACIYSILTCGTELGSGSIRADSSSIRSSDQLGEEVARERAGCPKALTQRDGRLVRADRRETKQ